MTKQLEDKMDWTDYMLPSAINALLVAVKNPASALKWKKAFLKIFNAIRTAYMGDPDFQ